MAIRGTKPKPVGQVRRRNQPTHEWTDVVDAPFEGGPRLPAKMPDGSPWPTSTRAWWAAVSTMPHCATWKRSDWRFALDTALVAAWLHLGNYRVAGELRNREKTMGTTVDFRRDLRVRYVDPHGDEGRVNDVSVSRLDDYRQL